MIAEDILTYFDQFRKNIIGNDITIATPFGKRKMIYADWVASGRCYKDIEDNILHNLLPYVANTHTESNLTGSTMTKAYHQSKNIIKNHVGANSNDHLIFCGSGMTGAIVKLQRILGIKIPERFEHFINTDISVPTSRNLESRKDNIRKKYQIEDENIPVVFITHMEHHSNHTSWLETICDVELIDYDIHGLVDLDSFKTLLQKYKNRKLKIASVTACSNVTGIETPYHEIAKLIHREGGYCFVDFACSAPYCYIDMHPEEADAQLDAIFFSPHKFLGGPGSSGVLVFNEALYSNKSPDIPGGGTVTFTSPWNKHDYIDNIENREDGGTPPFLQGIRAALAVKLKEKMNVDKMKEKKEILNRMLFRELGIIDDIKILAKELQVRQGAISIVFDDLHYNLAVRLLNDLFGIQVRGGCVCAGTYAHYLLDIEEEKSNLIRHQILQGEVQYRPGFVRISLHPTMTVEEVSYISNAVKYIVKHKEKLKSFYNYEMKTNEFRFKGNKQVEDSSFLNDIFWTKIEEIQSI